MMAEPTNINHLPNEVLEKIFSYLPLEDLACNAQYVCSRWFEVCSYDALWKNSLFTIFDKAPVKYVSSIMKKSPRLQGLCIDRPRTEILLELGQHCKNLRYLQLKAVPCLEVWDCVTALASLLKETKNLEVIVIPGTFLLNDELPPIIAQFKNLHSISITGYNSSSVPVSLRHFADGCLSLSNMDIGCVDWYHHDMIYFLQKKNNLHYLRVRQCSIDFSYITLLLVECESSLNELRLETSYPEYTSDSFSAIKSICGLKSLRILSPLGLTADIMISAFSSQALSHLVELKIEDCAELNDTVLHTICLNSPSLIKLGLRYAISLTDDGLKYLPECSKLEELDIRFCERLSAKAIVCFSQCANLKQLIVGPSCQYLFCPVYLVTKRKPMRIEVFNYNGKLADVYNRVASPMYASAHYLW